MLRVAAQDPQKILLFFHGLCEHSARCVPIAQALADEGVSVYLPEHYGHGRRALGDDYQWLQDLYQSGKCSRTIAEELQQRHSKDEIKKCRRKFTEKCRKLVMRDHLDEYRNLYFELKEKYPNKKILIGGFSLGGLLATALSLELEEQGETLDKLLLVSPAFMATGAPVVAHNFLTQALQEASKKVVALIHELRGGKNEFWNSSFHRVRNLNININTEAVAELTSDLPEERLLFRYDPLVADRVPIAYLNEIQELMIEIQQPALGSQVDTWMIYAEQDCIINSEGCARFGRERLKRHKDKMHIQAEKDLAVHDLIRSSRFEDVKKFLIQGAFS